eukprot:COSAG04_NODE_361_length_15860_cov_18.114904_12_plen_239_part_00
MPARVIVGASYDLKSPRDTFNELNTSQDGKLSKGELKGLFNAMPQETFEKLWKLADRNGDGSVDVDEFEALCKQMTADIQNENDKLRQSLGLDVGKLDKQRRKAEARAKILAEAEAENAAEAEKKAAEVMRNRSTATKQAAKLVIGGGATPKKEVANYFNAGAEVGFDHIAKGKRTINKDQFTDAFDATPEQKEMLWKLGDLNRDGTVDAEEFKLALAKLDSVRREVDELKAELQKGS